MLPPMEFLVEENAKEPNRDGSDWQINPKNERPMQMLDNEGTKYRSDDGGKSPNPRQPALHASPIRPRIDVAHDRGRDRLDAARAQSLDGAKHHERRHAPSETAGGRANEE